MFGTKFKKSPLHSLLSGEHIFWIPASVSLGVTMKFYVIDAQARKESLWSYLRRWGMLGWEVGGRGPR